MNADFEDIIFYVHRDDAREFTPKLKAFGVASDKICTIINKTICGDFTDCVLVYSEEISQRLALSMVFNPNVLIIPPQLFDNDGIGPLNFKSIIMQTPTIADFLNAVSLRPEDFSYNIQGSELEVSFRSTYTIMLSIFHSVPLIEMTINKLISKINSEGRGEIIKPFYVVDPSERGNGQVLNSFQDDDSLFDALSDLKNVSVEFHDTVCELLSFERNAEKPMTKKIINTLLSGFFSLNQGIKTNHSMVPIREKYPMKEEFTHQIEGICSIPVTEKSFGETNGFISVWVNNSFIDRLEFLRTGEITIMCFGQQVPMTVEIGTRWMQ